jgi:hypothetical protein
VPRSALVYPNSHMMDRPSQHGFGCAIQIAERSR